MALLLLFAQPTGGGGGISADLSVVDTADTLASTATITAAPGVSCTLSVTDTSDTLAATAAITGTPVVEDVNLGGKNKLFDTPGRRIHVSLSVRDDDDTLRSAANVDGLLVRALAANASTADQDDVATGGAGLSWPEVDTLIARCTRSWPPRDMIRAPRRRLVSSRYEAPA